MIRLNNLILFSWVAWEAIWFLAARLNHKKTIKAENIVTFFRRMLPPIIAFAVALALTHHFWPGHLTEPLSSPRPLWGSAVGMALLCLGFALTFWARVTLGGNWSGRITLKQDHELITTGPYRFVRHPIYTGLILALLGSAIVEETLLLVFVLIAVTWGFVIKARIEESYMLVNFGTRYEDYRALTGLLLPRLYPPR